MTDNEILALAAECGAVWPDDQEYELTRAQLMAFARACEAAERERAARVCDDEARIRTEAGNTHPEESNSRGRCFSAARAAINCAKGVRGGEVVGPNVRAKPGATVLRCDSA